MIEIVEVQQRMDRFDEAVDLFWKTWGSESNYAFYRDCMVHSAKTEDALPRFYVAWQGDAMIGTYALLRNDLISRQDLYPWLACLYVDPAFRGQAIGSRLLQHAAEEAARIGHDHLYLSTDLDGYYEKYGWTHMADGYGITGGSIKMYTRTTR